MAKKNNFSDVDCNIIENSSNIRVGIIISKWNDQVTSQLFNGAKETLLNSGIIEDNIDVYYVPGSFELTIGAKLLAENKSPDAIICLGCVIQGETRHFEFISNAVANGITKVGIETNIPVIFGVLTTDTFEQAKERAGGKKGNKGVEAAATAIEVIQLKNKLLT